MNKNGSNGILKDNNKERQLRNLIVEFDEKHNIKSKVSYKDIYEFGKHSFLEKKISFYPSNTWWKTTGKHLVDEYNMVKKRTIRLTEKEQLDVVEIMDLVEKHCGDKDALIKYLLPYNDLIDRLVDKINKLENVIQKLSTQLNVKDNALHQYEDTIKKQEVLIDSFFYTHVSSEGELVRIMQSGEMPSEILNYSLSETFGNPTAYLKEFNKRIELINKKSNDEKNNVIQFERKNNALSDKDDYEW